MKIANDFIEKIREEADIEIFLQTSEEPEEIIPEEIDKKIEEEADTPK